MDLPVKQVLDQYSCQETNFTAKPFNCPSTTKYMIAPFYRGKNTKHQCVTGPEDISVQLLLHSIFAQLIVD